MNLMYTDLFNSQSKESQKEVKILGKHIKDFDSQAKAFVYQLETAGQSSIQISKPAKNTSSHSYILLQSLLYSHKLVSLEISIRDIPGAKRRVLLSSSTKEIAKNQMHCRIPLIDIPTGEWVNIIVDLGNIVDYLFNTSYMSIESIGFSAHCRIKRITTLKDPSAIVDNKQKLNGFNCAYYCLNLEYLNSISNGLIKKQSNLACDLNSRKTTSYSKGRLDVVSTQYSQSGNSATRNKSMSRIANDGNNKDKNLLKKDPIRKDYPKRNQSASKFKANANIPIGHGSLNRTMLKESKLKQSNGLSGGFSVSNTYSSSTGYIPLATKSRYTVGEEFHVIKEDTKEQNPRRKDNISLLNTAYIQGYSNGISELGKSIEEILTIETVERAPTKQSKNQEDKHEFNQDLYRYNSEDKISEGFKFSNLNIQESQSSPKQAIYNIRTDEKVKSPKYNQNPNFSPPFGSISIKKHGKS